MPLAQERQTRTSPQIAITFLSILATMPVELARERLGVLSRTRRHAPGIHLQSLFCAFGLAFVLSTFGPFSASIYFPSFARDDGTLAYS